MLNPEKILGGLLRGAPRGSSILGKAGVGSIGLGLLGIAMEAAEHYLNKPQGPRDAGMPPPPPGGAAPLCLPRYKGRKSPLLLLLRQPPLDLPPHLHPSQEGALCPRPPGKPGTRCSSFVP